MDQRVAVNLGGRSQEEAGPLMFGQAERLMGAQGANFEGLDRQFQVINRAGGRSEMPDVIHRPVKKNELGYVLLDEPEMGVAGQMVDVVFGAGDEVINAYDFVAAREQQIGQVGAEEAGGAGDHGGGFY